MPAKSAGTAQLMGVGRPKAQGKEAMLMGTTSGRGPGRVMGGANVSLLLWEASSRSMEKEKESV
jgi:hypothetical protein